MKQKLVFIYDGECQFCNKFAELLELKSGLPNLSIINGRENISLLRKLLNQGYDLDEGAILLKDGEILHGPIAINWICSKIQDPSDQLLKILSVFFSSSNRTNLAFPFLLTGRRLLLLVRGISRKILA